jgi:hypothetical protein
MPVAGKRTLITALLVAIRVFYSPYVRGENEENKNEVRFLTLLRSTLESVRLAQPLIVVWVTAAGDHDRVGDREARR